MMTIYHILLGLLGLSLIILVHELGHFGAAKSCNVHVERLCLFLGKPLLTWRWGQTEFAIAWLPLGGYCKMKGEGLALQELRGSPNAAQASSAPSIKGVETPASEGKSFQDATALQKIFILAAGPLVNILFAFTILLLFQLLGYPEFRRSNRIIVLNPSELSMNDSRWQLSSPAEKAGLKSGDTVVQIGSTVIESFRDIRLAIALQANEHLPLQYLRQGKLEHSILVPAVNPEGRAWVGVAPWQDLLAQEMVGNSLRQPPPGIQPGMRLVEVNGLEVRNWRELLGALAENAPSNANSAANETKQLDGAKFRTVWLHADGQKSEIHLSNKDFANVNFFAPTWTQSRNLAQAGQKAAQKLIGLFQMQAQGLRLLLQGRLSLSDNLVGPLQISDQIGQVITDTAETFAQRWHNIWEILSLISFMIALTNLLPLGVLDGGQILLYSLELLARRPLPYKWVTAYQFIGGVVIAGLMIAVLSFEVLRIISY